MGVLQGSVDAAEEAAVSRYLERRRRRGGAPTGDTAFADWAETMTAHELACGHCGLMQKAPVQKGTQLAIFWCVSCFRVTRTGV